MTSTTYEVRDVTGAIVALHERSEDDGEKWFVWRRPDGRSGLNGHRVADLPLYGSERLRDLPAGSTVILTEGEKAADTLRARGFHAVGTVTGASSTPSRETLAVLVPFNVVIWADNDPAGFRHMSTCARVVRSLGVEARFVFWRGAPPGGDAADFGGDDDELRTLIADARAISWEGDDAEIDSSALRDVVPNESNRSLEFVTAKELVAFAPAAPRSVVHGLAVRGGVTELVGKVKTAGKTTFLLALARAVIEGEAFAGLPTERTRLVYLTEQPDTSFREALRRAGLADCEDVAVLSWHRARATAWPDVVAAAVAECRRRDAALLIVDTLPQWAGLKGDAENNSGDALEAVKPLQAAAATEDLAVVIVRHGRRSGGEVGDDGRGSSAFAGAVDVLLSLRRPEGQGEPNVRVLHALSRFAETPESLALQLTPDGYTALGSESAFGVELAKRAILDAAPTTADGAKTADELIGAAGTRRTSGHEAIGILLELGALSRQGDGRKGSPFRYWAARDSSGTHTPIGGRMNLAETDS